MNPRWTAALFICVFVAQQLKAPTNRMETDLLEIVAEMKPAYDRYNDAINSNKVAILDDGRCADTCVYREAAETRPRRERPAEEKLRRPRYQSDVGAHKNSLFYIPFGQLRPGERVTIDTPEGRISCWGLRRQHLLDRSCRYLKDEAPSLYRGPVLREAPIPLEEREL